MNFAEIGRQLRHAVVPPWRSRAHGMMLLQKADSALGNARLAPVRSVPLAVGALNPRLGRAFSKSSGREENGSGCLLISEAREDFQDLGPGGEHPAAALLVGLDGVHEFPFLRGVVALAGGGIDKPASTAALTGLCGAYGTLRSALVRPFLGGSRRVGASKWGCGRIDR